ncbi:MAG: SPOR domain-containing protein [Alphaproteobacteria bacterium]|nr:SPOR domain-containing protein [Alphaproteobacteria bacterium]
MRKQVAVKLAVSALALTTTLVACNPAAMAYRPGAATQVGGERKAGEAFQKAEGFARAGNLGSATTAAEEAVALAPRDVGYRMLLADLYLKTGRFQSAETTYGDVLKLDPENKRAGLRVALTEIALGRPAGAVASLDRIADTASPGDVGLAYALAGKTERAIGILEAAARAPGADGRVRQNLALAYALSGDWAKARTTAAQDVSPDQLGARLQNWAALANPSAGADKVATLFGTHAVADPGQPTRLALADPAPQRLAAAEPAPEPAPAAAATLAPEAKPVAPPLVQVAVSEPVVTVDAPAAPAAPVVASAVAAQPSEVTRPVYADAVQGLVRAPVGRATIKLATVRPFESAPRHGFAPAKAPAYAGAGKFAVQLGAFSSQAAVERAWAQAYKRYGFAAKTPLSTTVSVPGRGTFHRLSVAGFDSRASADRICASVRAHGGACFVRAVAGDAPVRWASRHTGVRHG